MKEAVVVFAKVPGRGNPKSRIARVAGKERAAAIYAELLKITSGIVQAFDCFVSFSGCAMPGVLKRFFPGALGFLAQREEPLGERVRHALEAVQEKGYGRLCAIGTDCPELTRTDIREAFDRLADEAEAVIGPAVDGGYYLIAVNDPDCGVFDVEGWGTEALLEQTMKKVKDLGLCYALLHRKADIDTLEAYEAWKSRLREGDAPHAGDLH